MRFTSYIWKQKFKIIGLALFLFIISQLDMSRLLATLKTADYRLFALAILFSVPNIFIKALRWRYLARSKGMSISQAFKYYWIALFWGAVTPGKVGELFKVTYLKDHGLSSGSATAVTVIDRLIDIICLFLLLYVAMFFVSFGMTGEIIWATALLVAGIIASILVLAFWRRFIKLFTGHIDSFYAQARSYGLKTWLLALFATFFTWGLFIVQRYIIAYALGIKVEPAYFAVVMLAMAFVTMIPISIQGIGTRDLVLVHFLGKVGYSKAEAVALAALILCLMIFNTFIGYFTYLLYGKSSVAKRR